MHNTTRAETCIVHDWVELAGPAEIDDFVILGRPIGTRTPLATVIGPGAVIRSHSVVYEGNTIGRGFSTGHNTLIREDNTVGDNVSVGSGSVVEHHVSIGHGVRIHSHAFIPEHTVLEAGCWIGPRVALTNARYPQSPDVKHDLIGPQICAGAKIGANATVLPGLRIGIHALVGAGAVVTKDVPDYGVVAGNPAVIVNDVRDLPYGLDVT